jgi:hypothetical protein
MQLEYKDSDATFQELTENTELFSNIDGYAGNINNPKIETFKLIDETETVTKAVCAISIVENDIKTKLSASGPVVGGVIPEYTNVTNGKLIFELWTSKMSDNSSDVRILPDSNGYFPLTLFSNIVTPAVPANPSAVPPTLDIPAVTEQICLINIKEFVSPRTIQSYEDSFNCNVCLDFYTI